MELTAEVIKRYHLDILKCATLEEKQNMFLSQVRNNKDFAILQHRKMWIWIAQQYAKGSKTAVESLKIEYASIYCYGAKIMSHCFCCEYSSSQENVFDMCEKCPIQWKYDDCCNDDSEYSKLHDYIFDYVTMVDDISNYLESDDYIPKKYYAMLRRETKLKHKVVKLAYKISQLPERKGRSNED